MIIHTSIAVVVAACIIGISSTGESQRPYMPKPFMTLIVVQLSPGRRGAIVRLL